MTHPPLPRREGRTGIYRDRWWHEHPLYTADQMRDYATAAVLAEREACAKLCEQQAKCDGLAHGWDIAAEIRARTD
jgi:hypothetical protein